MGERHGDGTSSSGLGDQNDSLRRCQRRKALGRMQQARYTSFTTMAVGSRWLWQRGETERHLLAGKVGFVSTGLGAQRSTRGWEGKWSRELALWVGS